MTEESVPALNRSQTDIVIERITTMLTRGELGPGARLPIEKDLAVHLGVSRGSLREGVRALAVLGILETRQGDGTYVTSLNPSELLSPLRFLTELQQPAHAGDLLAVRRMLEAESAALAATRLSDAELEQLTDVLSIVDEVLAGDPDVDVEKFIEADIEFHRIIARASGNPALAAMIDTLAGRTVRARLWRAITQKGAVHAAQAEHRAILAELERRDPERSRIRMQVHLLEVEEFISANATDDR